MRWLALCGYRAVDMDHLMHARRGADTLPRRPVVITFDDGFQGCVDHAVPVLRAHGFTAVFYLVTGLMGETSRWMRSERGPELAVMNWDTARTLAAGGFQCGAHSATHPRLSALDPEACRSELVNARRRLEQELDRPAVHLAYPYGDYDSGVRQMAVDAGYETACSTRPGLSEADDDLMAVHRITVYGHDSLLDFASRMRTGKSLRERLGLRSRR
jgi:peptidoglycan/xylan/chitin deacetylase (PgdA/CDA1 family)